MKRCEDRPVDCFQHIIGAISSSGGYQLGYLVDKFIKITITVPVACLMSVAINIVLTILVNNNLLKPLACSFEEGLRPKIAGISWYFR